MDQQNNNIPQQPQGGSVPPPPSPDEQVGVRTMDSDTESMSQSGGGAPQSQVFSASEAVGPSSQPQSQQEQNPFASGPDNSSGDFSPGEFFGGGDVTPPPVGGDMNSEPPKKGGSSLKTILIVIGIIIVAAAVGFGVYYLVTSLSSSTVTEPNTPEPSLPVEVDEESPMPSATATPFSEEVLETPSPSPTPEPIVHSSLIVSPDEQEAVIVESTTRESFETALNTSIDSPLLFGSVKDLSFQTNDSMFVSSNEFLTAYFPSVASTLSNSLEDDFTTWVFGDKTGGNKLGVIFTLTPDASVDDMKVAMSSLEASRDNIMAFFLQDIPRNDDAAFEEAPIEGISVRYLPFSVADQYVFEYAFLASNGERHLVFTTSYRQMVDILDRLSAVDVSTVQQQVTEPSPSVSPSPSPTPDEGGGDTSTSTEQ